MVSPLLAARAQMALSLGFHIVFAVIGMAMPVMMVIAEAAWLKTKNPTYLELTKRWSKGTAIFFAVGAVSGTVLSFELGLLWPHFMEFAGAIIGMPFSLEGFAFFVEAIFLGIYLYGRGRVSPAAHLAAGVLVAVSGAISGVFVVTANAWMNTPAGFSLANGQVVRVDPIAAMLNPAAAAEVLHMLLAAYMAVGIAVAGLHARLLLKNSDSHFHQAALAVALSVGLAPALLQPLSGDYAARIVARTQPAKLAAMEGQFASANGAPIRIGGLPDVSTQTTPLAIEVPGGLSFLAYGDTHAKVTGLSDIPRDQWPPVLFVHLAFQVMVAIGVWLAALAAIAVWLRWRGRLFTTRAFLRLLVLSSPLGFIAIEAGWTVTELGRQPWIIQGVMRTSDAVTPASDLWASLLAVVVIYALLTLVVVRLMRRQVFATRGLRN
ncbi:MAG TPA: cytochrome ubiquinol oxidase subunit I [Vicinamibacterales bacterium]|nr:cytochrome ubiquinol oxidase subunit I [Vicinamibacterales bacterium]